MQPGAGPAPICPVLEKASERLEREVLDRILNHRAHKVGDALTSRLDFPGFTFQLPHYFIAQEELVAQGVLRKGNVSRLKVPVQACQAAGAAPSVTNGMPARLSARTAYVKSAAKCNEAVRVTKY